MRYFTSFVLLFVVFPAVAADPDGEAFYESKVRPLLVEQCYSCHSATAKKLKGDLRLDTKAAWLKGGSSGPAIVPGKPDDSPLVQAIRRNHKDIAAMPPEKPLGPDAVAILVDWVKRGAPAPDDAAVAKPKESIEAARKRWPFTPVPATVPVPAVKSAAWPATDIDRFLLAKLEAKNLTPVGDADNRTLIRRATFDLIGLPPTPEEVDAFLKDDSPLAFEKLVDRLLASPRYGERWGRHWLDVVRYSDTAGDNSDFPIPQMAKYRNWVIDAVNADKPYDRFVKEQLAGDLMGGKDERETQANTIATGYIANARRFGSTVDDYPHHLTIEDTLDNVGRAFLGLTINCARCHDHKFDPVSAADYYGLYGIFRGTRYPWPGIELDQRQRDLVAFASKERVAAVTAERETFKTKHEAELKLLNAAKDKAGDDKRLANEISKKIEETKKQHRKAVDAPLPYPTAYAVAEGATIGDVPIQLKGDPAKPGEKVSRHFPAVLGGQALPANDKTSGRLALANWIASADNPLFARVMVNRVWLHHFGKGIVATPNDFGKQGTAPTHPELLDYLARAFIADGWSVKKLHKRMMLSHVYRLSSTGEVAGAETADPNNDLLARFRQQRLDAESIRDSLLAVSGDLDLTRLEVHPFPEAVNWNFTQHNPFRAVYDHNHRSVYLMTQRIQRHPFLTLFDGADTGASTGSRVASTSALQSLYFLNDPFVHARAKSFAATLPESDAAMIAKVYLMLFARPPTAAEINRGQIFLGKAAQLTDRSTARESYLRSLFRSNEFVYVN